MPVPKLVCIGVFLSVDKEMELTAKAKAVSKPLRRIRIEAR
jgi:hypothetical protein